MFLLASSPPRCLVWNLWASPNHVPHFLVPIYCLTHLPAAKGEASDLEIEHCAILQTRKQQILGQRSSISAVAMFSEVLDSHPPGRFGSVCDLCGRISLGMNLNKPFGRCVDLSYPGRPAFWAVAWGARFVFWLYLPPLAVGILALGWSLAELSRLHCSDSLDKLLSVPGKWRLIPGHNV